MAIVLFASVYAFVSLGSSIDVVLRTNMETVAGAQEMNSALQEQQTAFALLLSGDRQEAATLQSQSWHSFSAALAMASSHPVDDQTRKDLHDLWQLAQAYEQLAQRTMRNNASALQPGVRAVVVGSIRPTLRSLRARAQKVVDTSRAASANQNRAAENKARNWSLRILACTILAIGLAGWLARRLITIALTPLALLARQAESIAAGDLTAKSKLVRKDEIGELADSFDAMAMKLAEAKKSSERRLRRAEALNDAALESLLDPVIVTDARLRIAHLNRSAQGLFGPAPDSPRRPIEEHIHDRRIVASINSAMTHPDEVHPDDERLMVPIRLGSEERIYRLRTNLMRGDDGRTLGSVTVLEDVTYLRTLDRMKTEFIAVAAHELRTPITSLLLSAQILEEGAAGPLSARQEKIIQAQTEELSRLQRLVEELLDLSKLEAGTAPPHLELVEASEILRQAVQTVRPLADAKGVKLVSESADDLGRLSADSSQITRVLTNLLVNAVRHTPTGGSVTALASSSPDDVTFRVRDTGEGIPAEYLSRIFERFVQVPGATRGGAGLGLAIADRIVRSHGGRLSVASEIGKGSEFRLTLPKEQPSPVGENTV